MFLNIQKVTTARISQILIKSESIMLLETDSILYNGSYVDATRIEIAGFSKMGFHTFSTYEQISAHIPLLDFTAGVDLTICGAYLVAPAIAYPLIKTHKINNNTFEQLEDYAFNPTHIISAEEITFFDTLQQVTNTGLMVVLHDINPRKILTKMTFNELKTALGAVDVAHP